MDEAFDTLLSFFTTSFDAPDWLTASPSLAAVDSTLVTTVQVGVLLVFSIVPLLWFAHHHWRLVVSLVMCVKCVPFVLNLSWFELLTRFPWFFVKSRFVSRRSVELELKTLLRDTLKIEAANVAPLPDAIAKSKKKASDEIQDSADATVTTTKDKTDGDRDRESDKTFYTYHGDNFEFDPKRPNEHSQLFVATSCRTIFYCLIHALLEKAEEETGEKKIKIMMSSMQFGGFYRLLGAIRAQTGATIELYEWDLNAEDWTMDESSIDDYEVKTCDLIIAQHFFGVPFAQDRLFELGARYDIPVLEDLVQSGSLYGVDTHRIRGSDVRIWSCGLDKTPAALGGGLGQFRATKHGRDLFRRASRIQSEFPIDSNRARAMSMLPQYLWKTFSRGLTATFIIPLIGVIVYVMGFTKRGDYVQWGNIALNVRKNKSVSPFAHDVKKFCRRPNAAHLLAICYAMGARARRKYARISRREQEKRDLLLSIVPAQCHAKLFPWLTKEVQDAHIANPGGIMEFSWVCAPPGQRDELLKFLNDHHMVPTENTTWTTSVENAARFASRPAARIKDDMIILPNLHNMSDGEVRFVARALTAWCKHNYGAEISSVE